MCARPYLSVPHSVTTLTRKQGTAVCHAANKESFGHTFEMCSWGEKSAQWWKDGWQTEVASGHASSLQCKLALFPVCKAQQRWKQDMQHCAHSTIAMMCCSLPKVLSYLVKFYCHLFLLLPGHLALVSYSHVMSCLEIGKCLKSNSKKKVLVLVHSWVGKQIGSLSQQDISTRGIGGHWLLPHSTSTFIICLSLIIPKADYMAVHSAPRLM